MDLIVFDRFVHRLNERKGNNESTGCGISFDTIRCGCNSWTSCVGWIVARFSRLKYDCKAKEG